MALISTHVQHSTEFAWELSHRVDPQDKTLILCPDTDSCENLILDLKTLTNGPCFILPPLECDFIRNRGPRIFTRVERLKFLQNLLGKNSRGFYFVPIDSLLQNIFMPQTWVHKLTLSIEQEVSRDVILEQLVRLNFCPANQVEQAGEYAARGAIVDFFPSCSRHPIRIELNEDKVESIFLFDCSSQRRLEALHEISVFSEREFIFAKDFQNKWPSLRSLLDEHDWLKIDRESLKEKLSQQIFFSTIDYWGPVISDDSLASPSSLINNFNQVYTFNIEQGLRYAERQELKLKKQLDDSRDNEELTPPKQNFIYPSTKLIPELKAIAATHFEEQSSAIESSNRFPVNSVFQAQHNEAIRQGLSPLSLIAKELKELIQSGVKVALFCSTESQQDRAAFLFANYNIVFEKCLKLPPSLIKNYVVLGEIQFSFHDPKNNILLLSEELFFSKKTKIKVTQSHASKKTISKFLDKDSGLLALSSGDHMVHIQHGIGKYLGCKKMTIDGQNHEFIELQYADKDKLLIPVSKLNLIQMHSPSTTKIALDKMGGNSWQKKKQKAKKELASIAGELLHLVTLRKMAKGPIIKPDKKDVEEFAAQFPFQETKDQLTSIEACLSDLRGPAPADRLIVGDVGYGKTEVAMRAAHAAVQCGYQAAILCPTTVLAIQHEGTFVERFIDYPNIKIGVLSRFNTKAQNKETVERLKNGDIHIIVGTHRLLSEDIHFKNLGLLIVDEEQRFGVKHKEKLKRIRNNVHILTLTATPIPRTLNMSIAGLKNLSIITTPPRNRLSINTFIAKKNRELICDAINHEVKRGGQVYFVHNRVKSIQIVFDELKEWLPHVSVDFIHGQMDERQIEERLMAFFKGDIQVLLATSIIESGLDVPNANTLIVDRADHFGLSQLYQIRGRVGRSEKKAYCYFLLPKGGKVSKEAEERLHILENYQELGAGFHIASHDLDMRGGGDLLGRKQSGQIAALGLETYANLLQESIAEAKGEAIDENIEPDMKLGFDITIPDNYIPDVGLRLLFYKKLAGAKAEDELEELEKEMLDRFGLLKESVKNLVAAMRIKIQLRHLRSTSITVGKHGYSMSFAPSTPLDTQKIVDAVNKYPHLYQLLPNGKLLIRTIIEKKSALEVLQRVDEGLSRLQSWC